MIIDTCIGIDNLSVGIESLPPTLDCHRDLLTLFASVKSLTAKEKLLYLFRYDATYIITKFIIHENFTATSQDSSKPAPDLIA